MKCAGSYHIISGKRHNRWYFHLQLDLGKGIIQMSNLFVLNYHTVVPHWGFDVACRTLDIQFRMLKAFCNVVPLEEICNYVVRGTPPRRTTVAVTIDDGYLDTFVYAIPLCKKHHIRATLFPIASRIINDERIRPTLEDHWRGNVAYRDLYRTRRS